MRDEHSIGEEVAQAALRPAMHNEHGHEMQVRARVDVVRDAGGDDGEDGSGALTAEVEPGKEPIFPAQDQPSELTLPAIVGGLDVSIVEKEDEALPLPMQVAEGVSEWRLGRSDVALVIEPDAKLVEHGPCMLVAARAALLGGGAGERRCALDGEEAGDDVQALQRDGVARTRGLDETSSSMRPAPRAPASYALEERGDAGAVALDGAREVLAEKTPGAVRGAARRIEEGHPARVGPAPHGARADACGHTGIQDGDRGGIRAQQSRGAGLDLDERGDGREQIDGGLDTARESLRRDVHPRALEPRGLSLEGLVLGNPSAKGVSTSPGLGWHACEQRIARCRS